MSTDNLHALAKDYAQGVIDKETYRKARSELIDGILSGEIPVIAYDFPPPIDHEEADATVESVFDVTATCAGWVCSQ